MQEQKAATLATIFSDVLADLAFMFTDEQHADPDPGDPWLETRIGYRGPMSGDLRFRCSRSFTHLLASNLLGAEPSDSAGDDQADDAVKEFMNIVCGQLVTALHGTEDVFNLTIPTVEQLIEAPDFSNDDGVTTSAISVEGCRLQLLYEPAD